jgi:hypothetical protein
MSSVIGIFRVIQQEPLNFWIFVAVNLFFGGMAIWLPPGVATHHPTATASHELLIAFSLGHGYLFALALLAAASSYMVREYREKMETDFKDLKLYATSFSFILMVIMAILLALITYRGFAPPESKILAWDLPLITQVVLAILALFTAAYLFCLERLDDYPEFGKGLKDKVSRKIRSEMNGKSSTGIET